jgi:hypothetical protein
VLQSSERLPSPVFLREGQAGEIGSVNGEPDVPLGGKDPESLTTLLLPRKPFDERQFQGAMTFRHELIEVLLVSHPVRREP